MRFESLERGYLRCMASRRLLVLLVTAVGVLTVAAAQATASPAVRFGIQDDAWLEHGPGSLAERVATLEQLGVDIVRVTLNWGTIEPAREQYDWTRADALLEALRQGGLTPVVTLWGSPAWANGGRGPNWAPLPRADDFGRFAEAAASRYGFVRHWVIWNEPNNGRWLQPVSPAVYTARLLKPGFIGVKAGNPTALVAGGVTAPRAGGSGGMSPVDFLRGMARAGAQLDAYAHHPYPRSRADSPSKRGCAGCKTITMANLERLVREVGRAFPAARVWLTEYGYQTNPPDRFLGVTPELQARFVGEAALRVYAAHKVDMLVQYLYRDQPELGAWQSGLETARGRAKPALRATMFPLAQVSRRGRYTVVWGQVRPGEGPQNYVLQQRTGTEWQGVGGLRLTTPRGFLRRTLDAPKGAAVRLWYPARNAYSPTLVVR